ncbi:MAG: TolC family protein [Planctomycetota bacterium]|nr:TolC family protein [Planctomycetota bacterium]
MLRPIRLTAVCALAVSTACAAPRVPPAPLAPPDALEQSLAARAGRTPTEALAQPDAVALLRAHNPRIREARAALASARAVERAGTPAPNPTIALGPLLTGGSDVLSSGTWGLETVLGWTVFLANTRKLEQSLKQVRAHRAFVGAATTEREELLAMRGDALTLAAARAAVTLQASQAEGVAEDGRLLARRAEAGSVEPLDAELMALETSQFEAELAAARVTEGEAAAALAKRIGLDPITVPALALDPERVGSNAPQDRDALYALAEQNHPALDRIRADYLVAEKEMRLAVAEGIPTLDLGATFEREDDSNRLGFPLSIEVPLFDRNQVEIARANGRRCELRAQYSARLNTILADVDAAHLRLVQRMARADALEKSAGARADRAEKAARNGLSAGTVDGLRYVEVMRAVRALRLEVLEARADVLEAWSRLEQAVGTPLLPLEGWDTAEETR